MSEWVKKGSEYLFCSDPYSVVLYKVHQMGETIMVWTMKQNWKQDKIY